MRGEYSEQRNLLFELSVTLTHATFGTEKSLKSGFGMVRAPFGALVPSGDEGGNDRKPVC